jgi:hypothetical protein
MAEALDGDWQPHHGKLARILPVGWTVPSSTGNPHSALK